MSPTSAEETCYADRAWQGRVAIDALDLLAENTYRLRFRAPQIAERIVPGQFLMLRFAGCDDPLLGRALALYDTRPDASGAAESLEVVFLVVGKFTGRLARAAIGQTLDVWGPLGNGFPSLPTEHLVMVAGGIGQTPFLALAQEALGHKRYGSPPRAGGRAKRVTLCYGARRAGLLAGVEDFQALGVEVRVSTDDGSAGHHGLVTDVLRRTLADSGAACRIVACGPEPMLKAVAEVAARTGTPCQVSLETPMACGLGICFSCVARVRDDSGGWDYRRTCVEGPVFDAARLEF